MTSSSLTASGPNAEQITYWNEVSAERWIRYEDLLDRQLASFGARALERASIQAGEQVIDVGCGCGATTLSIAGLVGPRGSVVGVDIATAMLERARQRAREQGLERVRFENADAQTHAFPAGRFDVVFSRFGVMFFADPARAFANLRAALRSGGRLAFVCWQALEENPWMGVPLGAAATEIALPPRAALDAPGPFSFADPERVRRILATAGYSAIELASHREELPIASGRLDDAAEFLVQMGPTASALRTAPADARPRVIGAIRRALEPFGGPNDVRLRFAVWLVTAAA